MRWKVENYLWAPWCELPRRKRMRWVPPCLKTIFQSFHIFNIDNPQCWKVRNNPFLPWHLKSWFTFCRFGTVHFCTYKVQRFKILFYPKKALLWWQKKSFFEGTRPKIGLKWCASCAISRSLRLNRVSSLKVVMGSKKVHWDLKNSFGISKNVLRSQKILWDLKKCFQISNNALGSQKNIV